MDCPDLNTLQAFAQRGAVVDVEGTIQEHIDVCTVCFQTIVELALGNEVEPVPASTTVNESAETAPPSAVSAPQKVLSLGAVGLETALGFLPQSDAPRSRPAEVLERDEDEVASDLSWLSSSGVQVDSSRDASQIEPLSENTLGVMTTGGLSFDEGGALPPPPPPPPETAFPPGTDIDQYRVLRLLGRGGMGEVYLAKDLRLGRRVALKIVKPALLGTGDAVERFLFEARTTARFSHPNIVTIFGVGSVQGAPYVALEFLEGQDLRARMAESPPGLHETLRVILAVTQAVHEAHRHGILHRDLKPANILIPTDGRVRVVDFGLALQIDVEGLDTLQARGDAPAEEEGRIRGTPAYMAPEQWRAEQCTPATDVWAIGLMLHELCLGALPYRARNLVALGHQVISPDPVPLAPAAADLPETLMTLLERTLAKDPARRASSSEVIETIREVLFSGRLGVDLEESPFRGLLPFSERHTHLFFGRAGEVAAGVERLRVDPMLAVVGASGAGKSSFVQAGLIPRLRERGRWVVLRVRPGSNPLRRLASKVVAALAKETGSGPVGRGSGDAPTYSGPLPTLPSPDEVDAFIVALEDLQRADEVDAMVKALQESPRRLSLALAELARVRGAHVLLLVDQMEELFTLTADPDERRVFAEAVCEVADEPAEPVRTVFTLRDDFLGRFALLGRAGDALLRHVMVLGPPDADLLGDVLVRPLELMGYRFDDPELVGEMVAAVDNASSLPLLQFTARLLWERRDRSARRLRRADYEAIGGVDGALAKHADDVLGGLTPTELAVTRSLFLRLVTPERTRRVVTEATLLDGLEVAGSSLLGRLTDARLLTARRSDLDDPRASRVEIAHEALIDGWPTLGHWLDEGREELTLLHDAGQAAELWHRRGRQGAELWEGDALREALRAADRTSSQIPSLIRGFLDASVRRERARRRRRQALTAVIPIILAIIAAVLAIEKHEADVQRDRAEGERYQARAQQSLAQKHRREAMTEDARGAFDRGAFLEARAKLRAALETHDDPPAALRAIQWNLARNRVMWSHPLEPMVYDLEWSPDGQWVASAQQNHSVVLYSRDTGQGDRRLLRGHRDQVLALAFSPDGESLASVDLGGELRVFDTKSGITKRRWQIPYGNVRDLAFLDDGRLLASVSADRIAFWNPQTGALAAGVDPIKPGAFKITPGPGLFLLRRRSGASARLVFMKGGTPGEELTTPFTGLVSTISVRPDGLRVVGIDDAGQMRSWDPKTRTSSDVMLALKQEAESLQISPDGMWAATCRPGPLSLWHLASGTKHVLETKAFEARFSPDGRFIASAGQGVPVRVWDVHDLEQKPAQLDLEPAIVYGVALGPQQRTVISVSPQGPTLEWSLADGRVERVLTEEGSGIVLDVDAPGGRIAIGSPEVFVRILHHADGRELMNLSDLKTTVSALRFTGEGDTLLVGTERGEVILWDLAAGKARYRRKPHVGSVLALAVEPGGGRFVSSGEDRRVHVWDLAKGRKLHSRAAHGGAVHGLAFTLDGDQFVTGGLDSQLRLWSAADAGLLEVVSMPTRVNQIAASPVSPRFAIAGADGNVHLFEPGRGHRMLGGGSPSEYNVIEFTRDGKTLVVGSDDGTVRSFDAHTGAQRWWTRAQFHTPSRVYTHRGWLAPAEGWIRRDWEEKRPPIEAIEDRGLAAFQTEDGQLVCMKTSAGVEVWSMSGDKPLAVGQARDVVALKSTCLVLTDKDAWLLGADGKWSGLKVEESIVGVAGVGQTALVVTDEAVLRFDDTGRLLKRHVTGSPPTAVTWLEGPSPKLALGFGEGSIEIRSVDGESTPTFLEQVFSSRVVKLTAGPQGTLLGGYADGHLGLWDIHSGARLGMQRGLGQIAAIIRQGRHVYAATDMGANLTWDLGVFTEDRCTLLRESWRSVPVVWERGRAVKRSPPVDHVCQQR